ncbi:FliI/YscN family ATPase [Nevskia soli]|uniref:FliI/YscN family ATPase n=1 Tax=Nevskia soli TaxID=418856 RepID=UPI0004A6EB6F|nr:FliI/YscN family ATPase [Nevskia soli]
MKHYAAAVRSAELTPRLGHVRQYSGLILESHGPDASLGELCEVYPPGRIHPVLAETMGFRDGNVLLVPHGDLQGIRPGSEVVATGRSLHIAVGQKLLGRIIDAHGVPLDDRPQISAEHFRPLLAAPGNPVHRGRIKTLFETGIKAIDVLTPVGVGQRLGIFAGSGVGKSQLLGMLAQNSTADVNVVALIGERGREIREFVEENLGAAAERSVVVVAPAERSALERSHAAYTATTIAEYFRDKGLSVALLFDSLTRFAMARREIGLAMGEPPTARGYTPSVFGVMPQLVERAGPGDGGHGAITAFYTVLVEGDDLNDPIADSARSILDGHIVLSRDIANRGRYPAVDILKSLSRLSSQLASANELAVAREVTKIEADYIESKDLVELGAYKAGSNTRLDYVFRVRPRLEQFFSQPVKARMPRIEAIAQLRNLLAEKTL